MLKLYTTGPIVNSNEASMYGPPHVAVSDQVTGPEQLAGPEQLTAPHYMPEPISDKFKLVFDPIDNNRCHSNCCPCYVVVTLFKAWPPTLKKTPVSTMTAVLSDDNYTVIEFENLGPFIYEIEIKVFCPGIVTIVNIYGQKYEYHAYKLVPCHCFKFKELVVKEIKCDCEKHEDDEDDEKPCHKENCERPIRKRNRC